MRILLDTNVLLDAILKRPNAESATQLLDLCISSQHQGFISAKSVLDTHYIATKCLIESSKQNRDGLILTYHHADIILRNRLYSILRNFYLIDTTASDVLFALQSDHVDLEDTVLLETAARTHIDCIITGNAKDFAGSTIPIYAPAEFLCLKATQ